MRGIIRSGVIYDLDAVAGPEDRVRIGEAPLNTIEQESFECPRMARRTNQRTDLVPLFEQRPYEIRSELPRRTENENTHSHSALNDASNLYASQHGPNRRHEPIPACPLLLIFRAGFISVPQRHAHIAYHWSRYDSTAQTHTGSHCAGALID